MLKKFFDMNNPLMQGLQTTAYLLILNLLTFVCMIPIVTAGASFTAVSDVSRALARREETYPARMFLDSFKKNFKQGCAAGLIFIVAMLLTIFNYNVASALIPPFRFFSLAVGFIVLAASIYTFPLIARFENTVLGSVKNAFLLMVGFFPRTLGMVAFTTVFYVLFLKYPAISAPLVLMFGISLPAYVNAIFLNGVFEKISGEKAEDEI